MLNGWGFYDWINAGWTILRNKLSANSSLAQTDPIAEAGESIWSMTSDTTAMRAQGVQGGYGTGSKITTIWYFGDRDANGTSGSGNCYIGVIRILAFAHLGWPGAAVHKTERHAYSAGFHQIHWNVGSMQAGTYFCVLTTNTTTVCRQLVHVK